MRVKHYSQGKFYTIECPECTRVVRNSTFRASGKPDPCDGIVFQFGGKELRIPAEPAELLPLLAESGKFGISLVGEPDPDVRSVGVACPKCGETDVNWLQLRDGSESFHCDYCGAEFGLPLLTDAPSGYRAARLIDPRSTRRNEAGTLPSAPHRSHDPTRVIDRPVGITMHGGRIMLVISRKKDEGLVINDDITVTIIEIRGDKVRLGIEVPRHESVHRREVFEAIMAQSDRRSSPTSTPPTKITLTESQVALLERVRTSIALSGGPEPTLEQALGMLFDAVEEAEEHLTALVVDGVRGFRATSLPAQYDRISPSSSSTGSTVGDSAHSPSESRQSGQ